MTKGSRSRGLLPRGRQSAAEVPAQPGPLSRHAVTRHARELYGPGKSASDRAYLHLPNLGGGKREGPSVRRVSVLARESLSLRLERVSLRHFIAK
jgi:hypothetical protein